MNLLERIKKVLKSREKEDYERYLDYQKRKQEKFEKLGLTLNSINPIEDLILSDGFKIMIDDQLFTLDSCKKNMWYSSKTYRNECGFESDNCINIVGDKLKINMLINGNRPILYFNDIELGAFNFYINSIRRINHRFIVEYTINIPYVCQLKLNVSNTFDKI